MSHAASRPRGFVFENIEHCKERIEDPELDVAAGGCDEGRVQTALPPARTAGEHGRGLWVAEVTKSRASHFDEMASIQKAGKALLLCGARDQPSRIISQSDFFKHVGAENVLPNIQSALARARDIQSDFAGIGRQLAFELEHRPL